MGSVWKIEFTQTAVKQLEKLDKPISKRIINYLEERLLSGANPRLWGKALKGSELGDTWRYRVGDYRAICLIKDSVVTVVVLEIGHRKEVYR